MSQLSSAVDSNSSAIQNEANTRANETSSLATRIETIEANVGEELGARIEEIKDAQADLSGKMSAAWGVKLQVNSRGEYVTAGVGMDITSEGGVTQSNFIVQANNFIIQDGLNGAGQAAFAVSNGKVIIRSALIGDATITMAKIGGDLFSSDWVAGTSGWRLSQDGQFEINSSVPGQGRIEINNKGMRVFDSDGNIRVKIGDLR